MLIREFSEGGVNTVKLSALIDFLAGRAEDSNAKKQISKQALINSAKNLGINLNDQILDELVLKEPLSNILEPMEPNSDIIRFKGNDEPESTAMSVDRAEDIVNQNAKAAMRRGMK